MHSGGKRQVVFPAILTACRQQQHQEKRRTHACAPSDNAMNGSNDQSFSTAGFDPSSAKHNSISGPLFALRYRQQFMHSLSFSTDRRHRAIEKKNHKPGMMEIYNQDNRILAHDRFLSHARENELVRCRSRPKISSSVPRKMRFGRTDKTIPRLTNPILSG